MKKEPELICHFSQEGETPEEILTKAFSCYLLRLLSAEETETETGGAAEP